jgi:hypothetical protein
MILQVLADSRETSLTLELKISSSNLLTVMKSAYQLCLCASRRTSRRQNLPGPFEEVPWTPLPAPTIITGTCTYPFYAHPNLFHHGSQLFLIHPSSLLCHLIFFGPRTYGLLWFLRIFLSIEVVLLRFWRMLVNFSEVLKCGYLFQSSYRVPILSAHAYILKPEVSDASHNALRNWAWLLVLP